jgi:hypothetical protein
MRGRTARDRRCTYLVILDSEHESLDDLRDLADYLSYLAVADFDVVIVDGTSTVSMERNRRVLRWVGRYGVARPQHRNGGGAIDPIRTALDVASCEKIIVAGPRVRYDDKSLDALCALLDLHEVVEPQDYFDPLPWWSGIEAGRMLVHRGIPLSDHGATFGFRRSALRGLDANGAEVFSAAKLFVRRIPPRLGDWIRDRARSANEDFGAPAKAAFFFTVLPAVILLSMLDDLRLVAGYSGAIVVASLALAWRGRGGAARFFPWRACLYAPLWIFERSVSVYFALFRKLGGADQPPVTRVVAPRPDSAWPRAWTAESSPETKR